MTNPKTHPGYTARAPQIRAARALLGWSREEAARKCGVGSATISRLERDASVLADRTVEDILRGFRNNGIIFFDDERGLGVALLPDATTGRDL